MVPYILHGGDAFAMFNIDEYSNRIRSDFKKGGLFEGLIKKYILNNPHSLKLLMIPDE
jgi:Zn-dependent M16 (insulinase) family peptidase